MLAACFVRYVALSLSSNVEDWYLAVKCKRLWTTEAQSNFDSRHGVPSKTHQHSTVQAKIICKEYVDLLAKEGLDKETLSFNLVPIKLIRLILKCS